MGSKRDSFKRKNWNQDKDPSVSDFEHQFYDDLSVFDSVEELDPAAVEIDLEHIVADPDVQVRILGVNPEWVAGLVAVIEAGKILEPIHVFKDGDMYYVADGFHRVAAHREADKEKIFAFVHDGDYQAVKEFARDANLKHALQLTNDDKRKILTDRVAEGHPWSEWTARDLAGELGVGKSTISRWINDIQGVVPFGTKQPSQKKISRSRPVWQNGDPVLPTQGTRLIRRVTKIRQGAFQADEETKRKLLDDIDLAQKYLDELRKSLE